MAVLCLLWVGAGWAAGKGDRNDTDDRAGWAYGKDYHDKHHERNVAPVPQTGQVQCYDVESTIPCTGTGQDGALQEGVEIPTPRYTDKRDGTIKDNLTGLIWLKNANCPNALRMWQEALDDVKNLNSTGKMNGNDCGDTSGKKGSHRTDWRLPNVRELHSLVDYAFFNPAISNATGTAQGSSNDPFTNLLATGFYWSSTTIAPDVKNAAWVVSFFAGSGPGFFKSNADDCIPIDACGHVLAVRGGSRADKKDGHDKHHDFAPVPQTGQVQCYDVTGVTIPCTGTGQDGALQEGVEIPTPRYTDKRDGTIKDNLTGLIWLKNANCPNALRMWQEALDDVKNLNSTGKMNGNDCGDTSGKKGSHRTDWRLPNVRELHSLVDYAFSNPAISNAKGDGSCTPTDCAFSNFQVGYWSSTTLVSDPFFPTEAWSVDFTFGSLVTAFKNSRTSIVSRVLAVRGGDSRFFREHFGH